MNRMFPDQLVARRSLLVGLVLAWCPVADAVEAEGNPNPLSDVMAKADPAGDPSWGTEQFNEVAGARLGKELLPWLGDPGENPPENLLAPAFRATALRPPLRPVFKDAGFEVLRPESLPPAFLHEGAAGFRAAFAPLAEALGTEGEFHAKAKIVRVERGEDGRPWSTLVFVETNRGPVQQNAEWQCAWRIDEAHPEKPLLAAIELKRFEEIHAASASFADCTEAVLGANPAWNEQLVHGAAYWHANLDVAFGIHQGNQGVSIADANGDGLEDIFFCQPDGLPNRFFLQRPDGTLADHSRESGLDILDVTRCALFVDLDNDGDRDLILSHRFSVSVFENDGRARFSLKESIPTDSRVSGITAADYDNDGDLDFHVCGYSPMSQTSPEDIFANPVPYEDAENGAFNYLFRNNGAFEFADATEESGMGVNNTRFSFTGAWEDYDNDGDQDLYVANDFGRNNLYRNELVPGGKPVFTDVAEELGVEDIAASMSVDWADADNDGRMDLYVANMWSSAGNRIAYQQQFTAGGDAGKLAHLRRHARGNSFFRNLPDGTFEDASESSGLTMGRWAWGSVFADLNNDGLDDVYVANGFMTAPDPGDL